MPLSPTTIAPRPIARLVALALALWLGPGYFDKVAEFISAVRPQPSP